MVTIKKGYDIAVPGRARGFADRDIIPDHVALLPGEFLGTRPKLLVREGEKVKTGTPLFTDKGNDAVRFVAPLGGTVEKIIRGERRALEAVVIRTDRQKGRTAPGPRIKNAGTREGILAALLESGLFPCFRQRPFGVTANPDDIPRDIFIPAMDTAPLAPDPNVIVAGREDLFRRGLEIIARLTGGRVHLVVDGSSKSPSAAFTDVRGVELHYFKGPHPAGSVGVHIHHIAPIKNAADIVWHCSVQSVILIGRLFATGKLSFEITAAAAGPAAASPGYFTTIAGARLDTLTEGMSAGENIRRISGNVLTGRHQGTEGYLGFYDNLVTLLPEAESRRFLGWISPGLRDDSFSRSFLSRWIGTLAGRRIDTNMNGGVRPFVATGLYERLLPMDIHPLMLFKSIHAEDLEEMEELGLLDIAEEDVALCEYACPSKSEIQKLVRKGLDLMVRES